MIPDPSDPRLARPVFEMDTSNTGLLPSVDKDMRHACVTFTAPHGSGLEPHTGVDEAQPAMAMMFSPVMLISLLLGLWMPGEPVASDGPDAGTVRMSASEVLYEELGLAGALAPEALDECLERMERSGIHAPVVAIADMSRPSTEKRLFIFDIESRSLLMRTYVAHGRNTGDLMAEHFSNRHGSHQTSLGLYRVGARITSPKHGPALLLHGLEEGLNDQALAREVIIHGADYVSESFIDRHGRLGRSWGCPAVARKDMPRMLEMLAEGGVLYVHGC